MLSESFGKLSESSHLYINETDNETDNEMNNANVVKKDNRSIVLTELTGKEKGKLRRAITGRGNLKIALSITGLNVLTIKRAIAGMQIVEENANKIRTFLNTL